MVTQAESSCDGVSILADPSAGRIQDGEIRYVLMRPDVLMEIGRQMPGDGYAAFLEALERALLVRAAASFEIYRGRGADSLDAMLRSCTMAAAALGWGRWRFERGSERELSVVVRDSPFAEGHGPSNLPVCAPITGVLRAMFAAQDDPDVEVREAHCAAQGAAQCCFHIQCARSFDAHVGTLLQPR